MIKEILDILENDEILNQLIDNNIFSKPSSYTGECVLYSWIPVASNKIKRTDKLEINVVTETIEKGIQIEERLKQLLLTFADKPLSDSIKEVELNGGGLIYDYERRKYHRILYFYVLSREMR